MLLCCRILNVKSEILSTLGRSIQFELAIGMNGRIWLQAHTVKETIAVCNALCQSELMSNEEIQTLCKRVIDSVQGFDWRIYRLTVLQTLITFDATWWQKKRQRGFLWHLMWISVGCPQVRTPVCTLLKCTQLKLRFVKQLNGMELFFF